MFLRCVSLVSLLGLDTRFGDAFVVPPSTTLRLWSSASQRATAATTTNPTVCIDMLNGQESSSSATAISPAATNSNNTDVSTSTVIQDLDAQIHRLEQDLHTQTTKHELKLRAKDRELDKEVAVWRTKLERLSDQFQQYKFDQHKEHLELKTLERERERDLQDEIANLTLQLQKQVNATQAQTARAADFLKKRIQVETDLTSRLDESRAQIEQLEHELEQKQEARKQQEARSLEELEDVRREAHASVTRAEQEGLQQTQRVQMDFTNKLKQKEQELADIQTALQDARAENDNASATIESLEAERCSVKCLVRQIGQLTKDRVRTRVRRITSRLSTFVRHKPKKEPKKKERKTKKSKTTV